MGVTGVSALSISAKCSTDSDMWQFLVFGALLISVHSSTDSDMWHFPPVAAAPFVSSVVQTLTCGKFLVPYRFVCTVSQILKCGIFFCRTLLDLC